MSIADLSPEELQELLGVLQGLHGAPAAADPLETREYELDLAAFIRGCWEVLEPGTPYMHNWHIDLLAEHLMAVSAGEIKRLIINIPPRHMKSLLVSVIWPAWEWATRPESRWIFASYSSSLAIKHSLDRRAVLQSGWYQERWGERVKLTDDQNLKAEFMNTRRGIMLATSVGGTVTGKGGDRIVVDDPLNPEEAFSATKRDTALRFYDQTLSSRLDHPERGAIVVMMQRLHQWDLAGHLIERGGFTHLRIPAEGEEATVYRFPRSGRSHARAAGELLWPDRFGPTAIGEARRTLGPFAFAAQHQQRPVPAGGGIFPVEWWMLYDQNFVPWIARAARRIVVFVDPALRKGQLNDYSVAAVWADLAHPLADDVPAGYYLLDLWRDKVDFPELETQLVRLRERWKPSRFVIENKASGMSMEQTLKARKIPVELFNPDRDKEARAHAISGYVKDGYCHLPSGAPWLADFLQEHALFPKTDHDDQVDTTSMALAFFEHRRSGPAPLVRFNRTTARTRSV